MLLLENAGIEFEVGEASDGVTTIAFYTPTKFKSLDNFWNSSPEQLRIICDEIFHWDGTFEDGVYFTRDKASADFMSYAFAACGKRSVLRKDTDQDGNIDYRVFAHSNTKVGISASPEKNDFIRVPSPDGFKYCFTTSTGYWVMRRGGVIAVTGNCGMMAVQTTLKASHLPNSLAAIRSALEEAVPHGRSDNGGVNDIGSWRSKIPSIVEIEWMGLEPGYKKIVEKHAKLKTRQPPENQLGTLGTGNHFIEICLDEDDNVWVMLHSGSRGVGNRVGSYFIELAKKEAEKWFINNSLPDINLAYLPEGSLYFDDYVESVHWAQQFASSNRDLMMRLVLKTLKNCKGIPKFETTDIAVNCHHNYVEKECHFGKNVWVTRKGAIRARKGELGIIPGCLAGGTRILMSDGFYKNIEDIAVGDRIIAGDGTVATVTYKFQRGVKPTIEYQTNNFHRKTRVTEDHLHWIGDLSTVAKSYQSVKSLESSTLDGQSKYKWANIGDAPEHFTFLCPRQINFEIVDGFEYSRGIFQPLLEVAPGKQSNYDVGYLIGTFLGDGTSFYRREKGGQTSWSLNKTEQHIADEIAKTLERLDFVAKIYQEDSIILVVAHSAPLALMFEEFGKRTEKHLPKEFWCRDGQFLLGLYQGLIDTDGHLNGGTNKLTNTSEQIMELFGIVHYMLFGYLPSTSIRPPSAGGLDCDVNNCNTSFRATSLKRPEAMLTKEYQIIKRLSIDKIIKEVETFDLEVDHPDHSFIANNVIVHNSMGAKSFIVTGLGNEDSFCSASHGAGRKMSRTEARNTFTLKDHRAAVAGVECRLDSDVLDETPGAYKSIDDVIEAEKDLVKIAQTLKQIICIKG